MGRRRFFTRDMASGVTAVRVSEFAASPVSAGTEIRWRLDDPTGVLGMRVERSERTDGPWEPVGEAIAPGFDAAAQPYEIVDRDEPPSFGFRLVVTLEGDSTELFGPVFVDPANGRPAGCACDASGTAGPGWTVIMALLLGAHLLTRAR